METLESLIKERKLKANALNAVIEKIQKIESEIGLPELEKKYLGKYFKKKSRYSYGKSWWVYTHVLEISYPNSCIENSFEGTIDGKINFEYRQDGYLSDKGTRITKSEFDYFKGMYLSSINEKII